MIQQFKGQEHGLGFGSNPDCITVAAVTEKQSGSLPAGVMGISQVGGLGKRPHDATKVPGAFCASTSPLKYQFHLKVDT